MKDKKIGFAICGSFCTLKSAFAELEALKNLDAELYPIVSDSVKNTDTRFGKAEDNIKIIEQICGRKVISTIEQAEPIGPKALLDIMVVAPCTGNTMAKIAMGITDTPVTMAVKAHLRNNRPVLLNIATNDALGASAVNLAKLLNTKNIFFVPFGQDDPVKKSKSLIGDFEQLPAAVDAALEGRQLQPILLK